MVVIKHSYLTAHVHNSVHLFVHVARLARKKQFFITSFARNLYETIVACFACGKKKIFIVLTPRKTRSASALLVNPHTLIYPAWPLLQAPNSYNLDICGSLLQSHALLWPDFPQFHTRMNKTACFIFPYTLHLNPTIFYPQCCYCNYLRICAW